MNVYNMRAYSEFSLNSVGLAHQSTSSVKMAVQSLVIGLRKADSNVAKDACQYLTFSVKRYEGPNGNTYISEKLPTVLLIISGSLASELQQRLPYTTIIATTSHVVFLLQFCALCSSHNSSNCPGSTYYKIAEKLC